MGPESPGDLQREYTTQAMLTPHHTIPLTRLPMTATEKTPMLAHTTAGP
jgi:hypothetical protein